MKLSVTSWYYATKIKRLFLHLGADQIWENSAVKILGISVHTSLKFNTHGSVIPRGEQRESVAPGHQMGLFIF